VKVKRTSPILDAFYYNGEYANYLDIFNAIKQHSKNSTLTAWERDVAIYYFNPFLNQKVRFTDGDYVVIEMNEFNNEILLNVVHESEFEENYEVVPGTN